MELVRSRIRLSTPHMALGPRFVLILVLYDEGWSGRDCKERQLRPCTNRHRESISIQEPTSHVGLSESGWTASRCAGSWLAPGTSRILFSVEWKAGWGSLLSVIPIHWFTVTQIRSNENKHFHACPKIVWCTSDDTFLQAYVMMSSGTASAMVPKAESQHQNTLCQVCSIDNCLSSVPQNSKSFAQDLEKVQGPVNLQHVVNPHKNLQNPSREHVCYVKACHCHSWCVYYLSWHSSSPARQYSFQSWCVGTPPLQYGRPMILHCAPNKASKSHLSVICTATSYFAHPENICLCALEMTARVSMDKCCTQCSWTPQPCLKSWTSAQCLWDDCRI